MEVKSEFFCSFCIGLLSITLIFGLDGVLGITFSKPRIIVKFNSLYKQNVRACVVETNEQIKEGEWCMLIRVIRILFGTELGGSRVRLPHPLSRNLSLYF
jgi:hypothetical protein